MAMPSIRNGVRRKRAALLDMGHGWRAAATTSASRSPRASWRRASSGEHTNRPACAASATAPTRRAATSPRIAAASTGYVKFTPNPLADIYTDRMHDIRVHGGVTYQRLCEGGAAVFGFDTMHYRSDEYPITDVELIKSECEALAAGVLAIAAGREPDDRDHLPDLIGMLGQALRQAEPVDDGDEEIVDATDVEVIEP